jgi:hypothetical protein
VESQRRREPIFGKIIKRCRGILRVPVPYNGTEKNLMGVAWVAANQYDGFGQSRLQQNQSGMHFVSSDGPEH